MCVCVCFSLSLLTRFSRFGFFHVSLPSPSSCFHCKALICTLGKFLLSLGASLLYSLLAPPVPLVARVMVTGEVETIRVFTQQSCIPNLKNTSILQKQERRGNIPTWNYTQPYQIPSPVTQLLYSSH